MLDTKEFIEKAKKITPVKIVSELDTHIIGQNAAKRAVAIALRNRFRRMQVSEELRNEIAPKNILMIGPTGVGKTEIARRLAKLAKAPFVKVEATKFTEVGFVGRDVDSIIRDLVEISVKLTREQAMEKVEHKAYDAAEERLLDALLPKPKSTLDEDILDSDIENLFDEDNTKEEKKNKKPELKEDDATRQLFRKKLREGKLYDKDVEIELSQSSIGVEIMAPPGMEEMTGQLQNIFQNISGDRKKLRKLKVKEAFKLLKEEEAAKLVNEDEIKAQAIHAAEQNGIVFIDEIDKVTQRSQGGSSGADVSREGVQRDLLPLIEGCTISTKYGMIKTDHILFIASGAFHISSPSDLIPELQGRLPIRVELKALKTEDFMKILTEPFASLTEQYTALMKTENVGLKFSKDGIKRIAELAWQVNETAENIGARRLHTLMERLLEDISFKSEELKDQTITIDKKYVDKQLAQLATNEDLSKFIL